MEEGFFGEGISKGAAIKKGFSVILKEIREMGKIGL